MKFIINLFGIAFLVFGILLMSYHGYHYTKNQEIAKLGDMELTADIQKNVYVPPILGGLCAAAGVILLVVGKIKK